MLTGHKILVVEDQWLIAQELCEALREQHATVIGPAATLNQAMKFIESSQNIDAAVLNIELADGDVFPAAERLDDRGVSIVFYSGYSADVLAPRFADCPMWSKPAADLHAILFDLVSKPKPLTTLS